MATTETWHPVRPQITDPDLAPPANFAPLAPAFSNDCLVDEPQQRGFYQNHKFAIIVSVVILLIVIVVLFMYLTRKEKKKTAAAAEDGDIPPQPGPEDVNLDELNRLRDMRRQAREQRVAPATLPQRPAPAQRVAPATLPQRPAPAQRVAPATLPQRPAPAVYTPAQIVHAPAQAPAQIVHTPVQAPAQIVHAPAQAPVEQVLAQEPQEAAESQVDNDMNALISSLTDEVAASEAEVDGQEL